MVPTFWAVAYTLFSGTTREWGVYRRIGNEKIFPPPHLLGLLPAELPAVELCEQGLSGANRDASLWVCRCREEERLP